uniref:Uncharacterized protein n=1 Tax=Dulem virus 34 TaxID=3145752 RepID=A0AAU8B7X6_9CAUD
MKKGKNRPITTEGKYRHAVLVLQAIANRKGTDKNGCWNEWTEAAAYGDCRNAAIRALEYLGEPRKLPNMKGD